MKFSKGQIVVHPQHGPVTIRSISSRVVRGESKEYLTLSASQDALSIALPVDLAEELGVRSVVDEAGVQELFELLAADSNPVDSVWSRRFKDYTERLRSGNPRTLAGLIRDLIRRNEVKKISYGESGILREAISPFVAEIAIALSADEKQIEELVDATVRDRAVPSLTDEGLALAS